MKKLTPAYFNICVFIQLITGLPLMPKPTTTKWTLWTRSFNFGKKLKKELSK